MSTTADPPSRPAPPAPPVTPASSTSSAGAPAEPAPGVRASDGEREETVRRLHQALGAGCLDLDETDARAATAYAARYRHELPPLLADLPETQEPRSPGAAPTWRSIAEDVVWACRTVMRGERGERPTVRELRTAALVALVALVWFLLSAVLGAVAVAA